MVHRLLNMLLVVALVVLPVQGQGPCDCEPVSHTASAAIGPVAADACCGGASGDSSRDPAQDTRPGRPCDDVPGDCGCPMPCCTMGKTLVTVPSVTGAAAHPAAAVLAVASRHGSPHAAHVHGLKRPPRRAIPA